MSNSFRYDPVIVHYLARELDAILRGRECASAPTFAPDLSAVLQFDQGEQLRADLHPKRGWLRIVEGQDEGIELDAICAGVSAPADERLIHIDLEIPNRFGDSRRRLVLELPTNQWNAILLDESGSIINLLRGRRSATRQLGPGLDYRTPAGEPRIGATEMARADAEQAWREHLDPAGDAKARRGILLRHFAWTGSPNVGWIVDDGDLADAFERWWWLRGLPNPQPGILSLGGREHPYPLALRGVARQPSDSLIAAIHSFADSGPEAESTEPAGIGEAAASRWVRRRLKSSRRRLARLEEEFEAAHGDDAVREKGDLLLARLHQIPRNVPSATVENWEGDPVEITLDPELGPAENAEKYYNEAKRMARARQHLPPLIEQVTIDIEKTDAARRSIESSEVPDWVNAAVERDRIEKSGKGRDEEVSRSFRRFRTSGGLEVRVGRSSAANDRLTFRDSSPEDIWLHAQSVPGSHVILRWQAADTPPARDLAEAALLAALHSRARTSSTVAVDWTRRKHVRKPRGAAPGLVIPQRVKTLFVEPDAAAADRMAEDD